MAHIEADAVIAGKYRLVRQISGGGMGAVWLAHHEQLDAPVAVKFMHGSLLDVAGARARFEREAKAAAQLRSPYVVHVYDHGIDDETPFIVMEYLEGEDLGRRLKRQRKLPLDSITRICDQVCKGLYRAHRVGIVHRDLKPGNVWLSSEDDDMVKLLDFGIAKETGKRRVVKGETTTTGQVLGSPHYMSPEQARGQPLDGRSDLWSLAVIMYRALTGKRPFDGDDIGDLIVRICTDPVPPPSSLRPELGRVVDHFFERAFNRDPDARFQSAKAFAAEFKAALATAQPRTAAPPSKPDAVGSPSWDSRDSSSFTSELSPPLDQDALTQLTPSPRHAPDPSHGAEAPLGSVPSSTVTAVETLSVSSTSRRSRAWLAGAAGVAAVAVIGAAVAMVGDESGGSQASDAASVALPEPSIEVASSAAASAADSARPAASATTAASAAPTASASAPRDPSPRPPRVVHPPPHPKTPPPPQVPDLGY